MAIKTQTLGSSLSSADLCRRNGWRRGTILIAEEEGDELRIQITAVGDASVLAREVDDPLSEFEWDLTCRDWREA